MGDDIPNEAGDPTIPLLAQHATLLHTGKLRRSEPNARGVRLH